MRLAAIVIVHNGEQTLQRCLESLRFCNEIVVVDSGSTDGSLEIARQFTAQAVTHLWHGYADQKNFANGLSKADWVLSVDADEEVSLDLREEIQAILGGGTLHVAFGIKRKTLFNGRWIRHGGWYPNRVVRLFDRRYGQWEARSVHEFWQASGSVGNLQSDLIHHSFGSIEDQVNRNNHYSSLGAAALRSLNRRSSRTMMILKPASKFIETFILKRGFLDGRLGFIISVSAAYSVFLKWAKLWECQQNEAKV